METRPARTRASTPITRTRIGVIVLLCLVGVLAASCGGDASDTGATTSPPTATATPTATMSTPAETTPPGTTPAPPTTTSPTTPALPVPTAPATPPAPAPPPDIVFTYTGFPPVEAGSGAHGSGCAPGPGPLPDGIWFGFGQDLQPDAIEFDLACFFTGDAAATEAAARGLESPPPNDYLIVNDNPTLRTVPVAADAEAWRLVLSVELVSTTYADFRVDAGEFQACPGDGCLLWLYVNGGQVTEVVSQYVP